MTELRRSSRVRQSAKHTPQYYEPDEKTRLLSTPDVRPRKWHEVEASVGYFKVKRWVPKDQDHLTKELHGGLTDKGDGSGVAKFQLRGAMKAGIRANRRSRGAVIPTAAARSRSSRSSLAATSEHNRGGGGSWGAQAPAPGPESSVTGPEAQAAPPASGDLDDGGESGTAADREGLADGGRERSEAEEGVGVKRPASALEDDEGSAAELEPPLQLRRLSNDEEHSASHRSPPTTAGAGAAAATPPQQEDSTDANNPRTEGRREGHQRQNDSLEDQLETTDDVGSRGGAGGRGDMWGGGNAPGEDTQPWNI